MINDKTIKLLLSKFFQNKNLVYDVLDSLDTGLIEHGILCIPYSTAKLVIDRWLMSRPDLSKYIAGIEISGSSNQILLNTLVHLPKPIGGTARLQHTMFVEDISLNPSSPLIELKYVESFHMSSIPKKVLLKSLLGKDSILSYVCKKSNISAVKADSSHLFVDFSRIKSLTSLLPYISLSISECDEKSICLNFDFLSLEQPSESKAPGNASYKKVQGGFLRGMMNNSDRL